MRRTGSQRACAAGWTMALTALLAACGGVSPDAAAPPAESRATRPLSAYLHDLSPSDGVTTVDNATLEHYAIPTRDGVVLDSWIRRPPGIAGQPLILVVTPYYGGGNPDLAPYIVGNALIVLEGGQPHFAPTDPSRTPAKFFLPRGYAVGFLSIPGTGNSGGCYQGGGPAERAELADAIEYLAAQPWSNGKVGMIGASADGSTATEMYAEAPPALKAVVPEEALTDYYRYSFNNGVRRGVNSADPTYYYALTGLNVAGLEGGFGPADPAGFIRELGGELCVSEIGNQLNSIYSVLTADKTPYWHERDGIELVAQSPDTPRPAIFYVQGFQDANVDTQNADGFLEAVQRANAPWHAWLGQWVHNYAQPPDLSPCAALAPCRGDYWEQALLAWFDQFLKGVDTGILDAPPIQLQADDGLWRHAEQWPPAAVQALELHPREDGSLAKAQGTGALAYRDALADYAGLANSLPIAILGGTPLEFVSEPLEAELRITGVPRFETVATSSLPIANLVLTLLEEKPDGTRRALDFAALNLNHAASLDQGAPDIAGQATPAAVNFFPQDSIVHAGSRLVLVVGGTVAPEDDASGDAANLQNMGPNLLPLGLGANVSLDLAHSVLRLPRNPDSTLETVAWPQS